ncbi:MAG: MAPEG family protein [Hyphomicrobium sp.]
MPIEIVLPMGVLALWTLIVLLLIPITRIRAARAGRVHVKDFRYGESPNVPGDVSLPNRDYMNLLELPVLFYAACLVAYASQRIDPVIVTLAWAFVGARVAHSIVHLTYNNVLHRLVVFALGALIVMAMWVWQLWWVAERL